MTAIQLPGEGVSLVAAADLSALQYTVVKLDSNGLAAAMAAITDVPFGILQNAPALGEIANVIPIGSGKCSKIVLGATLTPGALITSSAAGKAAAAASTAYPVGQLMEGGALDEIGAISLMSLTVKV